MAEIQFGPVAVEHPAIDRLLKELRAVFVNRGALLGCFSVSGVERRGWFMGQSADGSMTNAELFLGSPAVAAALPELRTAEGFLDQPVFEPIIVESFCGLLGDLLYLGGAYHRFSGTFHEAQEIGQAACEAMFQHRYEDIDAYRSTTEWSEWSCDALAGADLVAVDNRRHRIWLLCVSDID